MCCYADDTTYVAISDTREANQRKIWENLEKIAQHLNANKLTINMGKTTLIETMTRQKRWRTGGITPTLEVNDENGEDKTIKPWKQSRLLGVNFSNDLT